MKNAGWILSGQGLQLAGRMAYFVIVARALGPAGYGSFVACTALVAAMTPFASCGTGHVMIKYAARDRKVLRVYFGNALLITVFTSILLAALALALRSSVLPASATTAMLIAVAASDLVGLEVTGICLQVFQVLEKGGLYSLLVAASTAIRLLAALVLLTSTPTPGRWADLYAASSVAATAVGILLVIRCGASPQFQANLLGPSVREGVHFATALASQSVYNDIDKTMLARLSSVESAAIYAVAYRFIEPAILPIRSVGAASYPDFFRHGAEGVTQSFEFARRILRRSIPYGIVTALALLFAAGLIPMVLGSAYHASAEALRWLCVLPMFKCAHIFLSDTLTGANHQWQTSSAQIAVSVFNVLVNLWIIRAFAWRGAAWSSLVTDGLLVLILYFIIQRHLARERAAAPVMQEPAFASGRQ